MAPRSASAVAARLSSALAAAAASRTTGRAAALLHNPRVARCGLARAPAPSSPSSLHWTPLASLRRGLFSASGAAGPGDGETAEEAALDGRQQQQQQQQPKDASQGDAASAQAAEAQAADLAAQAEAKIAELQYIRCLADMENLRARTRTEVEQAKQFAIQKFANDLLNTTDVIGMALCSIPKSSLEPLANISGAAAEQALHESRGDLRSLHEGVSLMEAELLKALRRNGVEKFDAVDQPFDPNRHQAM
ncbi:MAG: GrpE-domain-containing protein, partial [Olpidium bornovanus]